MPEERDAPQEETQHETPAPSENPATAEEIGQKAYGATKEATGHAISAIKILLSDPMGGQAKALAMLGDAKAFRAGLVFCAVFFVSAFMFGLKSAPMNWASSGGYAKLAIVTFVPAVALWVAFTGTARLCKVDVGRTACIFVTGVALLPTSLALLGLSFLGGGNIELIMLLGLFGGTTSILLLNSALLDVLKLSTRKAVLLTPTVIVATAYIAKVMIAVLYG